MHKMSNNNAQKGNMSNSQIMKQLWQSKHWSTSDTCHTVQPVENYDIFAKTNQKTQPFVKGEEGRTKRFLVKVMSDANAKSTRKSYTRMVDSM